MAAIDDVFTTAAAGELCQVRQGRPGDAGNAHHVDVHDPQPFLIGIVRDASLGADPGVVDHDVDAAVPLHDAFDAGAHLGVVRDVRFHAEVALRHAAGVEVEDGDGGAALCEPLRHGGSDAGNRHR